MTRVLAALVDRFRDQRVVVYGDLILDVYVTGGPRRTISPEAPVIILESTAKRYKLGGAANVADNIVALGGSAALVGIVGEAANDLEADGGATLMALVRQQGIGTAGIVRDPGRPTTRKTRFLAGTQQLVRVDEESRAPLAPARVAELSQRLTAALERATAVVVSDYGKGAVTAEGLAVITEQCRSRGIPVILDPHPGNARAYRWSTLMVPNRTEAAALAGVSEWVRVDEERLAAKIVERTGTEQLLVTEGKDGMTLFAQGRRRHFPTKAQQVFDVSGAGDTVAATLALALPVSSVEQAVEVANHAAGLEVAKLGTAVVPAAELVSDLSRAE